MKPISVIGKPCPIPVIEAKKALRTAAEGEEIALLVDNDISAQNIAKMAAGMGLPCSSEKQPDGNILVAITVVKNAHNETISGASGPLVVAIGKNTMGAGNDDLGAILVKGFIYSLTELETPPESVLFFNSGVKLATAGSNSIADLKTLESKGTVIASCGTCLDFYQLKDKLAVGSVTNMYAIVSSMSGAGRLINL